MTLPSGRVLWVEIFGAGSPGSARTANTPILLFANGMASTTNAWGSLVHSLPSAFLATHTLVLHGVANTGKSPYQAQLPAPSLSSLATDARSLLEHLSLADGGPCYWIGHSFGGQQGFVAAAQDTAFWEALLLLAPQTDRVNPTTRTWLNGVKFDFAGDPDTAAYANALWDTPGPGLLSNKSAGMAGESIYGAFAREMALRQRSEGLVLAFDALLAPTGEGYFDWAAMRTEIVLVFGGRDEIAPTSEGEYALAKLEEVDGARAKLVVLEGAGHWVNWECEARWGS